MCDVVVSFETRCDKPRRRRRLRVTMRLQLGTKVFARSQKDDHNQTTPVARFLTPLALAERIASRRTRVATREASSSDDTNGIL